MRIKPGKIFVELSKMPPYQAKRIFKAITMALGVPGQMVFLNKPNKNLRFRKK
jgi:hypothetical protein